MVNATRVLFILAVIGITLVLSACNIEVPAEVEHTGTVTTINKVQLEVTIPDTIVNAFTDTCDTQCVNQPASCQDACIAELQTNYINQLLELINLIQTEQQANGQTTN